MLLTHTLPPRGELGRANGTPSTALRGCRGQSRAESARRGPPKGQLSFLFGRTPGGGGTGRPSHTFPNKQSHRTGSVFRFCGRACARDSPGPSTGSALGVRGHVAIRKAEHTGKKKEKKNGKSLKEQSPKNAVACTCASWTGRDGPVAQAGRVPGVKSRPATNGTEARVFVYDRELRKAPRVRVGTEAP